MEEVVLVNEHDQPVGTMEKMAAHQQGLLHRAFSLLIYNSKGEMLLQNARPPNITAVDCGVMPAAAIPDPGRL